MKVKVLCTYDNRDNFLTGKSFNFYNIDFYKGNRVKDIKMFHVRNGDIDVDGGWFGWRLENGGRFSPDNINFKLVKYEP